LTSLALAIATKGEWDPDQLLQDLRSAGADASTEIHIACDPKHAPGTPTDGLHIHAKANASLFDLWGVAIAQSRSDWVAILHADALPAPGWFAAMNEAIARDARADGYMGPVEPKFGTSDPRLVGYLTEYVQFQRPLDSRLSEVPGNNLVLPRARLDPSRDFSKTRLFQQGLSPQALETAVVLYSRQFRLGEYCGRRFRHGRAYAAARTPRVSMLLAVPLTAALPFVRTARIMGHAWRHKGFRLASLLWLPAIILAESFWSTGELIGYVTRRPGDTSALD
jgi:hypothetical protein